MLSQLQLVLDPYAPFTLQVVVPRLEVFLGGGTTFQVTPFHMSCSHYRQMATDWTWCFNHQQQSDDSTKNVDHSEETSINLNSPL